jgi:hypothetical protein
MYWRHVSQFATYSTGDFFAGRDNGPSDICAFATTIFCYGKLKGLLIARLAADKTDEGFAGSNLRPCHKVVDFRVFKRMAWSAKHHDIRRIEPPFRCTGVRFNVVAV